MIGSKCILLLNTKQKCTKDDSSNNNQYKVKLLKQIQALELTLQQQDLPTKDRQIFAETLNAYKKAFKNK